MFQPLCAPVARSLQVRNVLLVSVALVFIAFGLGASIGYTISPTTTRTTTITQTQTLLTTVTNASTISCDTSPALHCVVFQQTGACNPEFWGVPWSVTIGATTEVQPPDTPLPLNNGSLSGTLNQNLTVIVFSLSDGAYRFVVSPSNFYFTPDSGTIDVNGSNVLVEIAFTGTSCTSTTATVPPPNQTEAATVNSSLGLRLGLQISTNATGTLLVSANETNLLSRVNNVTTANDWPYPNAGTLPCGDFNQFPIQYAVLQGYYDPSNYTSASALTLYDTGGFYDCPTMIAPIPYVLFAPLSDNASFLFSSGQEGSYLVSANYSSTGYWTGSQSTAAFHPFPRGIYTIIVEDEWGDVVLLHFTESE
jgi:hypothetical protein